MVLKWKEVEHVTALLRSVARATPLPNIKPFQKAQVFGKPLNRVSGSSKDKTMKHYSIIPVFIGMLAVAAIGAVPVIAEQRPSDNTITYWVKEALRDDPRIVASDIKVETNVGVVTLSGS